MYLAKRNIIRRWISKVQIGLGLICLFVLICGVTDENTWSMHEPGSIGALLFFLTLFLWLTYLGVSKIIRMHRAVRYNSIFELNEEGIETVESLAEKLETADEKIKKQLECLINKKYLVDCAMEFGTNARVILKEKKEIFRFVEVRCSNCGANVRIRKGFHDQCPYCDSVVIQKDNVG